MENLILYFGLWAGSIVLFFVYLTPDSWVNRFWDWLDRLGYLFSEKFGTKKIFVRGKIISLRTRKISYSALSLSSDGSLIFVNQFEPPNSITKFFVFLDEVGVGKHCIQINFESFQKLKERRKFLSKEITVFYFKKYFIFGTVFDHVLFQEEYEMEFTKEVGNYGAFGINMEYLE